MYLNDINTKDWKVSKELKIIKMPVGGYSLIEQECGILILRSGIKNEKEQEIQISCNNQVIITELSHSEFFTLEEVEISEHERGYGFVLAVKGTLDNNGLTIRKKKPVFSEDERQIRADRARKNLKRKG